MKNKFIRLDYNFFWSGCYYILFLICTILLFIILGKDDVELGIFFLLLIMGLCLWGGIYMTFFHGMHFKYDKNIIRIYDNFLGDKIKITDVSYIKFYEKIKKHRKKLFPTLSEFYRRTSLTDEPEYVYRNGKVLEIKIVLKNGSYITFCYPVLFKQISTKIVKKQEEKIKLILEEFRNYKYNNNLKKEV